MELIQGTDPIPEPPVRLGTRGNELWRAILSDHELRTDELRVLEDACREVDLIERLEENLQGEALVVKGSQGQPAPHPSIQELRQHRALVARLLSGLKLPDDEQDTQDARNRSERARRAALTRWHGAS